MCGPGLYDGPVKLDVFPDFKAYYLESVLFYRPLSLFKRGF